MARELQQFAEEQYAKLKAASSASAADINSLRVQVQQLRSEAATRLGEIRVNAARRGGSAVDEVDAATAAWENVYLSMENVAARIIWKPVVIKGVKWVAQAVASGAVGAGITEIINTARGRSADAAAVDALKAVPEAATQVLQDLILSGDSASDADAADLRKALDSLIQAIEAALPPHAHATSNLHASLLSSKALRALLD